MAWNRSRNRRIYRQFLLDWLYNLQVRRDCDWTAMRDFHATTVRLLGTTRRTQVARRSHRSRFTVVTTAPHTQNRLPNYILR